MNKRILPVLAAVLVLVVAVVVTVLLLSKQPSLPEGLQSVYDYTLRRQDCPIYGGCNSYSIYQQGQIAVPADKSGCSDAWQICVEVDPQDNGDPFRVCRNYIKCDGTWQTDGRMERQW
jgi:hypothetical protein